MDRALRDELLHMRHEDDRVRSELARDGVLFVGYHPRMAEVHREHAGRMREILASGWPDRGKVGPDGEEAAWLLVQHAIGDPTLMRLALPSLDAAVKRGSAAPAHLAYLTDRIRVLEGRPQLYGTAHDWDASGELNPLPIEDPDRVDERRRDCGLEPLAEHTKRLRDQARAEGEGPPTEPARRAREQAAWARAIGWRD